MSDPNDDKTILARDPKAGAPLGDSDNALPLGTRLGEFELIGLIGVGGFGIVYLAEDHSLGRRVALKEYMPSSLAARGQGSHVSVKSERYAETFEAGRRSFVNEARLLAQFDHPSLVKVYRFWEANGTAYMVMPFYEGITLKQALKQMDAPPDEAWLKALLAPVLDALEAIHKAQVYHRDIAPDNIMLLEGGRPLLLDFGAARRVITDMTHALTVILKPGYAPVEQYAEMPEMKQGAWTDIYALCAVVHFAIMGRTPPPSVGRIINDSMVPLAQQAAGRYSEAFLRGIDRGLAVKPAQRPQTIAELRDLLGIVAPLPAHTVAHTVAQRRAGSAQTPQGPSPVLLIGGLLVVAAAVGAGYYYFTQPQPGAPATVAVETPKPPPATPTQEAAPAAETKPFKPLDEIDRIFQQRSRDFFVVVELEQAQVRIGRDRLRFSLRANKSGYLYILMVGTDRKHFYKLFPNSVDGDNRVEAGKEITLPRSGWIMVADGPPGSDLFVAVVSESPRDFADSGMVSVDPFGEFPLEAAPGVLERHTGKQSPFIGRVVCPAGEPACSEAYGAAVFAIEEVEASAAAKPRAAQSARKATPPRETVGGLPRDGRPPGQSIEEYVRAHTAKQQSARYPSPSRDDAVPPGIPAASGYASGMPRLPGY